MGWAWRPAAISSWRAGSYAATGRPGVGAVVADAGQHGRGRGILVASAVQTDGFEPVSRVLLDGDLAAVEFALGEVPGPVVVMGAASVMSDVDSKWRG